MENTNNIVTQKRKADKMEIVFIISMLILPICAFLLFYVYINFNSILMAFQRPTYDGTGAVEWGFTNFKMFFDSLNGVDSDVLLALRNTLIFYFTNILIKLPLSLIICYFIYKKLLLAKVHRAIIYLPNIITGTIFATLYKYMVGSGGPLFAYWEQIGVDPIYLFADSDYAMPGMLIFTIYTGLGGNFVLLGGAMNAIDTGMIDAGKIDGAGPFRELVSIIMPTIWPTLSTMILMSSIGVFTADGPLLLFTQGQYKTMTLNFWIFGMTTGIGAVTDYEYASAVGLIFTILGLPIVFAVNKILGVTKEY
ncbi:MAG: sugar ABC transporter permease [Clostridia bacterium]|nr:sugar ABC transporter permease [Clostridia bacterium]